MSDDRTYLVIPAEIIRKHALHVPAKNRWKAMRAARNADPSIELERLAVVVEHQVFEHGGESWKR